jgi:Protein of unknown function (DUF2510)
METALGFALLAGYGFAFWMWIDALCVPRQLWRELGKDVNFPGMRSKGNFFAWWYVGGFFTGGLIPIGLSIDYYRRLRPRFRAARAATPVLPAGPSPTHAETIVGVPAHFPAGWYADPSGRHQHRYWDGARWTEHVANNGITNLDPPSSSQAAAVT